MEQLQAAYDAYLDVWVLMLLHGVLGFSELSAGNLEAAGASLSSAAALADRVAWPSRRRLARSSPASGSGRPAPLILTATEKRAANLARPATPAGRSPRP